MSVSNDLNPPVVANIATPEPALKVRDLVMSMESLFTHGALGQHANLVPYLIRKVQQLSQGNQDTLLSPNDAKVYQYVCILLEKNKQLQVAQNVLFQELTNNQLNCNNNSSPLNSHTADY